MSDPVATEGVHADEMGPDLQQVWCSNIGCHYRVCEQSKPTATKKIIHCVKTKIAAEKNTVVRNTTVFSIADKSHERGGLVNGANPARNSGERHTILLRVTIILIPVE